MPITSSTGQAKRNAGATKPPRPLPPVNQITISLSRYMRDNVPTMAIDRLTARMVANWPSSVYHITTIRSAGLKPPRVVRPSTRNRVWVITMVSSTTKVAPKLRASSLRRVE